MALEQISTRPRGEPDLPPAPCQDCGATVPPRWLFVGWVVPPRCDACTEAAVLEIVTREQAEREARRPASRLPADPGPYLCPPGDQFALEAVAAWTPGRTWLYLHGQPGRGKSHLAKRIIHEHGDHRAAFVTAPELVAAYRATFDADGDSQAQVDRRYRAASLLVLDDLGAESSSAFSYDRIFDVIDHRSDRTLPTVITSNLSPQQVAARYAREHSALHGSRIESRLVGACLTVTVGGADFRRNGPREEK